MEMDCAPLSTLHHFLPCCIRCVTRGWTGKHDAKVKGVKNFDQLNLRFTFCSLYERRVPVAGPLCCVGIDGSKIYGSGFCKPVFDKHDQRIEFIGLANHKYFFPELRLR